jgi:hypothetical protein
MKCQKSDPQRAKSASDLRGRSLTTEIVHEMIEIGNEMRQIVRESTEIGCKSIEIVSELTDIGAQITEMVHEDASGVCGAKAIL